MAPVISKTIPNNRISKNQTKRIIKAIKSNDLETIKKLYSNGIHIDAFLDELGQTNLAWHAAVYENIELLKFAKIRGANFNIEDIMDISILQRIIDSKNQELIAVLFMQTPEFISREEYVEPDYDIPALITYSNMDQKQK